VEGGEFEASARSTFQGSRPRRKRRPSAAVHVRRRLGGVKEWPSGL